MKNRIVFRREKPIRETRDYLRLVSLSLALSCFVLAAVNPFAHGSSTFAQVEMTAAFKLPYLQDDLHFIKKENPEKSPHAFPSDKNILMAQFAVKANSDLELKELRPCVRSGEKEKVENLKVFVDEKPVNKLKLKSGETRLLQIRGDIREDSPVARRIEVGFCDAFQAINSQSGESIDIGEFFPAFDSGISIVGRRSKK
jgi:hypothetical protein